MKEKINPVITALMELEAKECHRIFFEYGNGLFRVRICHISTEKVVYEQTVNPVQEQEKIDELSGLIRHLKSHIKKTLHPCYKREFVTGKISGEWKKIRPVIEFGDSATQSMLIDGSGYYIDDPDNEVQYFVDYKQSSEINKQY